MAIGSVLSGIGAVAQGIGALGSKSPKPKDPKLPRIAGIATPSFLFAYNQLLRRQGGAFGPEGIPARQAELLGFTRGLRGPLTALQSELRPGFGRLSRIASTTIRQRGAEAVGNLRAGLARRGVLGSSFASDAIARVQSEFAQQEEVAQAQAVIAEIAAQTQLSETLIQQAQAESAQIAQQIQTEFAEAGLVVDIATQVRTGGFSTNLGAARINALRAELGLEPEEEKSPFFLELIKKFQESAKDGAVTGTGAVSDSGSIDV